MTIMLINSSSLFLNVYFLPLLFRLLFFSEGFREIGCIFFRKFPQRFREILRHFRTRV